MKLINKSETQFALITAPAASILTALSLFFIGDRISSLAFLVGAALSTGSLALGGFLVRKAVHVRASKRSAISTLQVFFLLKLPVFGLLAYWASSLGLRAAGWFLAGVVLVYLFLFVGAILSSFAPSNYDEVC